MVTGHACAAAIRYSGCGRPQPRSSKEKFPDVTGAPAPAGKQASGSTPPRRSPRTRSIRAAKPLLARLLHRQSVGTLTGRAAFPLMASALAIA
jgi:hypothetical protein